ncbi:hypothetical protein ACLMJK_007171 [Lecanora helva]
MAVTRKTSDENRVHSYKYAHNPLLRQKASEKQERTRKMFLEKVRQTSDNKRWELRSEQIMRQDFFAKHKQWEKDQACAAPEVFPAPEEEKIEGLVVAEEADMVDEILSLQDQEINEFASWIEHAENQETRPQARPLQSDYGSDEDEYDHLFVKMLSETSNRKEGIPNKDPRDDYDMDISFG